MFVYKKQLPLLIISFITFLLIVSSKTLFAEDIQKNKHISFKAPWIRAMPPMAMTTAGYVEIHNSSYVADKLLKVWSSEVESIEIHQTKQDGNMLKMLPADNTSVPPKGKLVMQPGGYHLMMMGIKKPLIENEIIKVSFEFETAGIIDMNFPILKK
jgi:copper(I)-binding protein